MKNGIGQFQNILLVGGTSEIGNSILECLPLIPNPKIFRIGKDISSDINLDLSSKIEPVNLEFIENLPDIDVAIFASGILGKSPDLQNNDEVYQMAMVNFVNSILFINRVTAKMSLQGHGKIIVLSSVAALRPRVENYIYGATKSGLDFYVRGLQEQLRGSGVSALLVRPGFIHTKMTAGMAVAPFAIHPQAVGIAVASALVRGKSLVYVPRILKFVFVILNFLPKSLFRKITSR